MAIVISTKKRRVWDLRHGCYTRPITYQRMNKGSVPWMVGVLRNISGHIKDIHFLRRLA